MNTLHTKKEEDMAPSSIYSQDTIPNIPILPQPPQLPPKQRSTRTVLLVVLTVFILLVFGISGVLAFMRSGLYQQPQITPTPQPNPTALITPTVTLPPAGTPTTAPLPVNGQWTSVLTGYKLTSLAVAPSNPQVLYACAVPPGLPASLAGVETVLRSADSGNHWQDIGKQAGMSRGCELTINPVDSYEIYVSTSASPPDNPQVLSFVLKHTSTGGDRWETLHPTVHGPGLQITPAWYGFHLSFVSNHLYSLQSLPIPPMATPTGHEGPLPVAWTRLLMSSDGGYTWEVIDSQFYKTWQSVWAYAVNPVDRRVIYELVSLPGATPGEAMQAELYKSIDGGTTWQALLQKIPGTPRLAEVFLGRATPDILYLRAQCPAQTSNTRSSADMLISSYAGGSFDLCMSTNGGKNWRTIAAPQRLSTSMDGGLVDTFGNFYTFTLFTPTTDIWQFNPVGNTWRKLTKEPSEGTFLLVTPTGSNKDVTLWFMGTDQGKLVLYRFRV